MRATFFVHDLSSNPIVRAYPFVRAFERLGWEVEVLGLRWDDRPVFEPYRDRCRYVTRPTSGRTLDLLNSVRELAGEATGSLMYAFKPLPSTLLPALIASGLGRRRPLLLDVEDEELWDPALSVRSLFRRHVVGGWRYGHALKYKLALHPFTRLVSATTVVSSTLRRRYGGVRVLHGPDEDDFDPRRAGLDRAACRGRFGLPANPPLILFAGVPHPHKGLALLVSALCDPRLRTHRLVLAGPPEHEEARRAANRLGDRCIRLGYVPNATMPELLTAVDVVALPQQPTPITQAQVPAKLLEAMAMEKVVVASRVSDIPKILGEGEGLPRGWVFDPLSARELADILARLQRDPAGAQARSEAARRYFLDEASVAAISGRLSPLIEALPGTGEAHRSRE